MNGLRNTMVGLTGLAMLAAMLMMSGCNPPKSVPDPPTVATAAKAVDPVASTPKGGGEAPAGAEPKEPVNLGLGPVSVFDTTCKRCHGVHGNLYPEKFYKLTPREMAGYVHEMMNGQAQLTPGPAEEQAMTAHHLAMQQKTPFVVVTNARAFLDHGGALKGEAPGMGEIKVVVLKGDKTIPVEVQKGLWTLADPPGIPFKIRVSNSDTSSTLEFPAQLWSLPKNEKPEGGA